MNFCILGSGSWGTAMALHLARFGHPVSLVTRRMEHALQLASERENRDYLPGIRLHEDVQVGCELKPALMEAEVLFLACPSQWLRAQCEGVRAALSSARRLRLIVSLCKGLERVTLLSPTSVIHEVLPDCWYGVLSGPTFAGEVARAKPTAIVFASNGDVAFNAEVQIALSNEALRVYTSDDVKGVELGGALKNVYAIAVGMCDGLQLGDNAKASLITRALLEMKVLGSVLGGCPETFYGLSGLGDLTATCNGASSRNRMLGQRLAEGSNPEILIDSGELMAEGYWAAESFYKLCRQRDLTPAILMEVYAVLYEGKSPQAGLYSLMNRELKAEKG